jgi:hypothetical protein
VHLPANIRTDVRQSHLPAQTEGPDMSDPEGFDYAAKSDLDIARHINLALLLHGGISEQDAGFDTVVGLNDAGLSQIARIVGEVRRAARGDSSSTGAER